MPADLGDSAVIMGRFFFISLQYLQLYRHYKAACATSYHHIILCFKEINFNESFCYLLCALFKNIFSRIKII